MNPYHHFVSELARLVQRRQAVSARRLPDAVASGRRRGCAARAHLLAASRRRVHHRRAGAAAAARGRHARRQRRGHAGQQQGAPGRDAGTSWRPPATTSASISSQTRPGRARERSTSKTRAADPAHVAGVGRGDRARSSPSIGRTVVFFPHDADWNSTHIGTHHLLVDALGAAGAGVHLPRRRDRVLGRDGDAEPDGRIERRRISPT